jgi:hypothetical protein
MQEEIQNNNWRSSLDELECIPGEASPALTDAWQTLHARLAPKENTYKLLWWVAAAACVIVVFLLSANKDQKLPAKNINNVVKSNVEIKHPVIEQEALVNKPIVNKTKKGIHAKKPETVTTEKIEVAPVVIEEHAPPIAIIETPPAPPPVKKLRVIHINELQGNNSEENKERMIESYVSNSTSDKILKIKISPSN